MLSAVGAAVNLSHSHSSSPLLAASGNKNSRACTCDFFFVTAVTLSVDNLSGASPGAFLSNDVFLPASGLSSDVALSGPIAAMTGNAVPLSCGLLAI
jgi:hypothetical protein